MGRRDPQPCPRPSARSGTPRWIQVHALSHQPCSHHGSEHEQSEWWVKLSLPANLGSLAHQFSGVAKGGWAAAPAVGPGRPHQAWLCHATPRQVRNKAPCAGTGHPLRAPQSQNIRQPPGHMLLGSSHRFHPSLPPFSAPTRSESTRTSPGPPCPGFLQTQQLTCNKLHQPLSLPFEVSAIATLRPNK